MGVSRAWLDHSGLQMQTTGRSLMHTKPFAVFIVPFVQQSKKAEEISRPGSVSGVS